MACLVAGGNVTHAPDTITYSSVVTREMVCIVIMMTVLHDLEVTAKDALNAYVKAPKEKRYKQY